MKAARTLSGKICKKCAKKKSLCHLHLYTSDKIIEFLDATSERGEYLDNQYDAILQHATWKLCSVDIKDLDFEMENVSDPDSQSLVEFYSELKTSPPPIIIIPGERGYRILDGYHRVGAAILNGKKKLKAYMPI